MKALGFASPFVERPGAWVKDDQSVGLLVDLANDRRGVRQRLSRLDRLDGERAGVATCDLLGTLPRLLERAVSVDLCFGRLVEGVEDILDRKPVAVASVAGFVDLERRESSPVSPNPTGPYVAFETSIWHSNARRPPLRHLGVDSSVAQRLTIARVDVPSIVAGAAGSTPELVAALNRLGPPETLVARRRCADSRPPLMLFTGGPALLVLDGD